MVVLVDRGTASAAEIVTGALQDRDRAKVVGTHTYGKGVFQEIEPLPNGGALDITVGEYFTPNGHNLGGGGVEEGAGHQARRLRRSTTRTPSPTRRSRRRADGRGRAPVSAVDKRRPAGRSRAWPCSNGRGKFLVAEPFFGSGPRLVVSRDRRPTSATWSWSAPARAGRNGAGRAGRRSPAGSAAPTSRAT